MAELSDYERERLAKVQRNRDMLASMQLTKYVP